MCFNTHFLLQLTRMKVLLTLILSVVGISICHPVEEGLHNPSWKAWKYKHGKVYKDLKEERIRNFVWQDNLKKIIRHNEEGGHSYTLAMNHLGDLVNEIKKKIIF